MEFSLITNQTLSDDNSNLLHKGLKFLLGLFESLQL